MEKRIIKFFIVTLLFLITYTYFVSKFFPQHTPPSIPSSQLISKESSEEDLTSINQPLEKIEVDKFIVSICLTGGYIKNLFIKEYNEELNFQDIGLILGDKEEFSLKRPSSNVIVLENKNLGIKKIWEFNDYIVKMKIDSPSNEKISLFSLILSLDGLEQRYQEILYKEKNKNIIRIAAGKIRKLDKNNLEILGGRDRYYTLVLFNGVYDTVINRINKKINLSTDIKEIEWVFYVGPQLSKELAKYNLEEIINYGFFHDIGMVIVKIFYFINYFVKNWGLSIILLSIIIYIILFPFTFKSTKAMKKMQELQPLIEEIREKYKDSPQKLNKEILEIYKKNKINPLGGCLPLLFQFPILFAIYQVFLRLIELKGVKFLWIEDLTLPDRAFELPFKLPFLGNYINLLPLIIIGLTYFQQKLTTPQSTSSEQTSMGIIFMILIGVIFYNFPSCIVIYWLTQNLLTLIYQYRVSKIKKVTV
ncbi:MAG: membrane protein insertase YidC [Candidatus Omnitrophica bacterium]|nr:membrane protein insertase YidC [Candidatus Omnitrophota bacterium]